MEGLRSRCGTTELLRPFAEAASRPLEGGFIVVPCVRRFSKVVRDGQACPGNSNFGNPSERP